MLRSRKLRTPVKQAMILVSFWPEPLYTRSVPRRDSGSPYISPFFRLGGLHGPKVTRASSGTVILNVFSPKTSSVLMGFSLLLAIPFLPLAPPLALRRPSIPLVLRLRHTRDAGLALVEALDQQLHRRAAGGAHHGPYSTSHSRIATLSAATRKPRKSRTCSVMRVPSGGRGGLRHATRGDSDTSRWAARARSRSAGRCARGACPRSPRRPGRRGGGDVAT